MTVAVFDKEDKEEYQEALAFRKCLIYFVGALVVVIVAIGIYVAVRSSQTAKGICLTRQCIESAHQIADYMDEKVDPCQDFYHFSCGNFVKRNQNPPSLDLSQFDLLEMEATQAVKNVLENPLTVSRSVAAEKMKMVYRSCINDLSKEDLIETSRKLKTELYRAGFGKWPEVLITWDNPSQEFFSTEELLSIFPFNGMNTMFELSFDSDTQFRIYPMDKEERDKEKTQRFFNLVDFFFDHLHMPMKNKIIPEILEFDVKFNEITNASILEEKNYTLSEMDINFSGINWTLYIGHLKNRLGVEGWNGTEDAQIFVTNPDGLSDVMKLITGTPQRTFYSYLVYKFIIEVSRYIGEPFLKETLIYTVANANISKIIQVTPLWKKCFNMIHNYFDKALTLEYAKVMWNQPMYDEIKYYMDEVKSTFANRIHLQTWLDHEARQSAKKKVESITVQIAFPQSLLNITELDKSYKDINLKPNNFIHNMLLLRREASIKAMKLFKSEDSWMYAPNFINAANFVYQNYIIIPIGILNPPFFQRHRPRYLNYAAIGSVLAHELGHSFDIDGIRVGFSKPWSKEIKERYKEKANCIRDHHSSFIFTEVDPPVKWNGTISWPDDISDKIGLNLAYRAYLEHENLHGKEPGLLGLDYSNHQLFFIQFAQQFCSTVDRGQSKRFVRSDHSPGVFRVLGTVTNDPNFGKVFQCPVGSPMNPPAKCELWA